tara:strand:+ start:1215 stop:1706 length:492 start_codon:yes stop_codon:yes gene_type:complete
MKLELKSGYSYCSEQILQFINDINNNESINILEFGAGDSSIKIYKYLQQIYKKINYTCYETDINWVPKFDYINTIIYRNVENVILPVSKYDLILVDGPTGITRKFWYEKIKSVTKSGTIVHIDDYDHYKEFEEELKKNLEYDELYRKTRSFKGEKSWLTVKIK